MPEYHIIFIGSKNYTNGFIAEAIELAYPVHVNFLNPTEFLPTFNLPPTIAPNIVIFDINSCSGMGNAPDNIRKLTQLLPETCLLVINPYKEDTLVQPLIDAGTDALLPTTPTEKEIITVVDHLLHTDCSKASFR